MWSKWPPTGIATRCGEQLASEVPGLAEPSSHRAAGLFSTPTMTPVSVNAVAVLRLAGADARPWFPGGRAVGSQRRALPVLSGVAGAGRLGVGVVCLLPALVVGVKGGCVRMEVRGGEWAWRRGGLSVGALVVCPGSRSRASTPRSRPRSVGWPGASQAEAAASGSFVAHPCHNQADPPWTVVGATRARASLHREGELIMKRTARALFMAGALVLTLGVAAPAQAGKADPVPIKGTLVGTETEFDVDGVTYTCSEPAHELVVGTLTGKVSHLGKVTREISYCAFWEGPEQYRMFDFTQVLTAANGDTLESGQGPFEGTEVDGWTYFAAETPIVGGTGRFAGASGTLYEDGRMAAPWWPEGFPYTTEGNEPWVKELSLTYTRDSYITYDASKRAAK